MKEKFLEKLKYEYNYSDLTINGYDYEITKFLDYLNDNHLDYKKINIDMIRNYLKYLDSLKYKKNSISKNLSSLRSYYKFLTEEKVVLNNPFKNISNPKKDKKLPDFLNYEEINKLFDSADTKTPLGLRNRCILELLYDTGIRVSELVNLKINDIEFDKKTINILGKGKKERIVYYGDYLQEVLEKYINDSRKYLLNNKLSEYLILNNNGSKITTRGVEYIIDKMVNEAAIKHKISPHVLRHTFATHMLNGGADIKSIQQLLGHESLSTTGIYTHITNDVLRQEYLKNHPRSKLN
mgnify:FL=1